MRFVVSLLDEEEKLIELFRYKDAGGNHYRANKQSPDGAIEAAMESVFPIVLKHMIDKEVIDESAIPRDYLLEQEIIEEDE